MYVPKLPLSMRTSQLVDQIVIRDDTMFRTPLAEGIICDTETLPLQLKAAVKTNYLPGQYDCADKYDCVNHCNESKKYEFVTNATVVG